MAELEEALEQDSPQGQEPLTELGSAQRLVRLHGQDLRYDHQADRWYVWNGRFWQHDESGEVMRRAKDVPAAVADEADLVEDEDQRGRLRKFALSLHQLKKLSAMINLARSERGMQITAADTDRDADLLNVRNGVVRLTDGKLLKHERRHLMTKICRCDYDPDADRTDVLRVVRQICQGDAELESWLQRACGYTLFGHQREEVLFFVGGQAATGKTTLLEPLHQALGGYGCTAGFSTFLSERQKNVGANPDIARLAGARMVLCEEVDEGARLAEGAVKQLTGRSAVVARHLYGAFFEFAPTFKLWLVANDKPRVRDDDPGVWRRMRYLHLGAECVVPEAQRDPFLKERLLDPQGSMRGLLAWAVEGAQLYAAKGLGTAKKVQQDSTDYRADMDPINGFIEEHCEIRLGVDGWYIPQKEFRRIYDLWCAEQGQRWNLTGKQLGARLRAKGVVPKACRYGGLVQKCWVGIRAWEEKPEARNPKPDVTALPIPPHGDHQSGQGTDGVTSGYPVTGKEGKEEGSLLPGDLGAGPEAPF